MNNRNNPDISIIVPVYKVEHFIERCAKSLFEQTYHNLEYIFVDDCTPDRSMDILSQTLKLYPSRIDQVKMIRHETNKGVASARNTGLKQATGSYIGWVDSDDWVETTMFERLFAVVEKHNADIVWCDFYNSFTDREDYQSQYCKENKTAYIQSFLVGKIHGGLCFSIVKKEIYDKHKIRFPEEYGVMEDARVMVQLFYHAETIRHIPSAYYHYVKDKADSITTRWANDPSVEAAAKANLLETIDFLAHTDLSVKLQHSMRYAKLIFKKGLLNTNRIEAYKRWKELFAEENRYILCCPNMTLRQKVLGWCISHGWWFVAKLWIRLKKGLIS